MKVLSFALSLLPPFALEAGDGLALVDAGFSAKTVAATQSAKAIIPIREITPNFFIDIGRFKMPALGI